MGQPDEAAAVHRQSSTIASAQKAVADAKLTRFAARERVTLARALRAEARLLREAHAAAARHSVK